MFAFCVGKCQGLVLQCVPCFNGQIPWPQRGGDVLHLSFEEFSAWMTALVRIPVPYAPISQSLVSLVRINFHCGLPQAPMGPNSSSSVTESFAKLASSRVVDYAVGGMGSLDFSLGSANDLILLLPYKLWVSYVVSSSGFVFVACYQNSRC